MIELLKNVWIKCLINFCLLLDQDLKKLKKKASICRCGYNDWSTSYIIRDKLLGFRYFVLIFYNVMMDVTSSGPSQYLITWWREMVSAPHQGYDNQGDETFLEQVRGQELMI